MFEYKEIDMVKRAEEEIPRSEIHLTYKDSNSISCKYIGRLQKTGDFYVARNIVITELYDDPEEFFK